MCFINDFSRWQKSPQNTVGYKVRKKPWDIVRKKHCDKQKSFCGPFWKLKCWAGSYVFEIFFSKWKMVLRVSVKPSPSLSPIDNWLWDQLRAILNQKSLKPEGCFIGLEYNGMTFADVNICIILFFFENKVVSCTKWLNFTLNLIYPTQGKVLPLYYTFCCSLRENTQSFAWNGDQ